MIRRLLEEGARRLSNRHDLALFTDGEAAYASLFPEIFGVPYRRYRPNNRGRPPKVRYRIPRSLAHVQIVKKRRGRQLKSVTIKYRHGTRRRAQEALYNLRHALPNTAIIERRNATARCMNATQTRRTLAFSRHPLAKLALGWWTLTVLQLVPDPPHAQRAAALADGQKKYVQRTPAMAIGIANRVFTIAELVCTPVYPSRGGR
jgi:hypothetical protein